MKNEKLTLDQLKIKSFKTMESPKALKGGSFSFCATDCQGNTTCVADRCNLH